MSKQTAVVQPAASWLLPALFGLTMLGLAVWAVPGLYRAVTAPPAAVGDSDVRLICEKFVSASLRSPATAKFSPASETAIIMGLGTSWRAKGWVDSQNGFGALVRSDYDCAATFTGREGNTQNWRSDSLVVTPR